MKNRNENGGTRKIMEKRKWYKYCAKLKLSAMYSKYGFPLNNKSDMAVKRK